MLPKLKNKHKNTQFEAWSFKLGFKQRQKKIMKSIAFAQPTNTQPVLLPHGALSSSKGQHCVL